MTGSLVPYETSATPMDAFTYRDSELHAEDVPLRRIAEQVGTPFYCYATAALEHSYAEFEAAARGLDHGICYALKANSNLAVVRLFARLGAGADVVSEGEMRRALEAGVPAGRIVFSGVGKKPAEMRAALEAGIMQINIESEAELEALSAVARAMGRSVPIAIRVNPDVDAGTHAKITTGRKENKFGIDIDRAPAVYARARALPGIEPVGVALHIGSQITETGPFRAAFARAAELVTALRAQGIPISRLDLGGGIGISYRGEPLLPVADYMKVVRETVGGLGCELTFEPGRRLVGQAGVLVSEVIYLKPGHDRDFVIVDAAMNDLIRPTLYEAWQAVEPVRKPADGAVLRRCDVVGPVCESGDYLALGRDLPPLAPGDLVVVRSAGAYGAVMASTYNSRPLVPEVLVRGGEFSVIRPRQTLEDLLRADRIPPWLSGD